MDKRLSRQDPKALLSAPEKTKQMQMQTKEEEKRWAEMEIPLSLAGALAKLTKDELSSIRSALDIRGVSTLTKQRLAEVLVDRIPVSLAGILDQMDEERYKVLKKIADGGGHGFVPLEPEQLDYFKGRGLLFTGTYRSKKTIAMPEEVVRAFELHDNGAYRKKIRANTEYIKLAQGLLYYYGLVGKDEFDQWIEELQGKPDFKEQLNMLFMFWESQWYYRQISCEEWGYSDGRIQDPIAIEKEQQFRAQLSPVPVTKEQLLAAGEPGYVERNPYYRPFTEFLTGAGDLSREEAERIADECVLAFKNGTLPSDLVGQLQSRVKMREFEMISRCMDHLVPLYNHTGQWALKGYSPNALSAARRAPASSASAQAADVIDMATRKKIGRNDPCPCGSGNKFKKCCGK